MICCLQRKDFTFASVRILAWCWIQNNQRTGTHKIDRNCTRDCNEKRCLIIYMIWSVFNVVSSLSYSCMYIILHCRRWSAKWTVCSSKQRTPREAKINKGKFRKSPSLGQTAGQKGKCLRWGQHLWMQLKFSFPQHLDMMTIRSGDLECRSFSPQLELLCK